MSSILDDDIAGFVPTFTVNGRTFPFVPTHEWSYREGKTAKSIAGGLAVVEIERRIELGDPDAMLAALVVSAQRVDPRANVEWFLDGRLLEFFESMAAQADEARAERATLRELEEAGQAPPPAPDPTVPAEGGED